MNPMAEVSKSTRNISAHRNHSFPFLNGKYIHPKARSTILSPPCPLLLNLLIKNQNMKGVPTEYSKVMAATG